MTGRDVRGWAEGRRRTVGFVGAVLALAMATLWTVVVPDRATEVDGVRQLAVRWGHPLCWVLLALAGVLYAVRAPAAWVAGVTWAALAAYLLFLGATVL
ncbi:hypothetical protein [Ornithinimicrobium kibberense]|uniref:Uncharacterized protein n=1 Tax=Ornithinimicrobium kibberense TaxID=282060 RepID=A0ABV5V3Z5_9MICO|nr:hypothetical protein [Ornithinimicrobium kibberense]